MKIKAGPIILFFIIYIWAYAIFNAVNAKADTPTITIPYKEGTFIPYKGEGTNI